jgi:hypothetical protein
LLDALKARQARRDERAASVASLERLQIVRFDRKATERKVLEHLAGWRAVLTGHVQDGRDLFRNVLAGSLRFTPDGKRIGLKVVVGCSQAVPV